MVFKVTKIPVCVSFSSLTYNRIEGMKRLHKTTRSDMIETLIRLGIEKMGEELRQKKRATTLLKTESALT